MSTDYTPVPAASFRHIADGEYCVENGNAEFWLNYAHQAGVERRGDMLSAASVCRLEELGVRVSEKEART